MPALIYSPITQIGKAMTYIYPLDSSDLNLDLGGGKAANLARLARAGFGVPPGFVVLTPAYRAFVAANDLQGVIEREIGRLEWASLSGFEAASTAIRKAFAAGEVPADIVYAIRDAYDAMAKDGEGSTPAVAVRSSATAEDLADASFAGQQDTFLSVRGEDALLQSVQACWSSLWTARAMAYRARQGIGPEEVALAVVVQRMAPAETAGVLFTVNPITGQEDEVVINATWGLGEALVSGRVNPDTIVASKATGAIRQLDVGEKAVEVVADGEGQSGTGEREVAEDRRSQASVTAAQVEALAGLAREVEAAFGSAQDVEWAFADGQLVVLQSRPVTASAAPVAEEAAQTPEPAPEGDDDWPPIPEAEPQPFDLWSQMDVGERWPEPVTPLTWSTWYGINQESMNGMDAVTGLSEPYLEKVVWGRRAYGRIYLNEGAMVHLYADGYGMPGSMIADAMGSHNILPERYRGWRWGTVLRRAPALARMMIGWERDMPRFEALFSQIDEWVDAFMRRDLDAVGDVELWRLAEEVWRRRLMEGLDYHIEATSMSSSAFSTLESLCARWLGGREVAHELITGLTGVIAAEIVPSLWEMTYLLQEAGLAEVVRAKEPAEALAALRESEDAGPFLKKLDAFLQRHGHRCMTEAEWLYPRWIEAPALVVESVQGYLRAGSDFDPTAIEEKQRRERLEATREAEARLDRFRRRFFRSNLERAQRLLRIRDNGQHYLVKLLLPMRHVYATLARRWATRGWLEEEQFFFLVVPEIEAVLAAGAPEAASLDLRAIAVDRRAAYDYWFTYPAPEMLDRQGRPLAAGGETADDASVLSGVPASRGAVEGTARVILQPSEAAEIEPGSILVTRATDPGWTPVFSVIGGLVLEIGGQLSHGAIVAREYGLPAVVNVPGATQRIADGQRIRVDGAAGRVYLSGREDAGDV